MSQCDEPGRDVPGQLVGYYVERTVESWEVYRCPPALELQCVDSDDPREQRCATNRNQDSLTCSECEDDHYPNKGDCDKCPVASTVGLLVVVVILFFIGLFSAYHFCNSPVTQQASTLLTTSVSFGMMLTGVQSLSILGQMSVRWQSPLAEIMEVLQLFAFDVELLRLECVMSGADFSKYIGRVLIPVVTVAVYVFYYVASHLIMPLFGLEPWHFPKTFNSVGQVWQALYITISLVAFLPFQCYSHPNGKLSILQFPHVICWEEGYSRWFGTGVFFTLLYGVGFFGACLYANIVAVRRTAQSPVYLQYFRFLFFRFRVDKWFWGTVLMIRSLLISLVPIAGAGDGNLQILYFGMVLAIFVPLQCYVMPWKTKILNLADTIVMIMLWLILIAASAFTEKAEGAQEDAFTVFIITIFGISFFVVGSVAAFAVSQIALKPKESPEHMNARLKFVAVMFPKLMPKLAKLSSSQAYSLALEMGDFDQKILFKFVTLMVHQMRLQSRSAKGVALRISLQNKHANTMGELVGRHLSLPQQQTLELNSDVPSEGRGASKISFDTEYSPSRSPAGQIERVEEEPWQSVLQDAWGEEEEAQLKELEASLVQESEASPASIRICHGEGNPAGLQQARLPEKPLFIEV